MRFVTENLRTKLKLLGLYTIIYLLLSLKAFSDPIDKSSKSPNLHSDTTLISIDFPSIEITHVEQRVMYLLKYNGVATVNIKSNLISDSSKTLIYDLVFNNINFSQTKTQLYLDLEKSDVNLFTDYTFLEVIKRFDLIPPGHYNTEIKIDFIDTNYSVVKNINYTIDSSLSIFSNFKDEIDQLFLSNSKTKDFLQNKSLINGDVRNSDAKYLEVANKKLYRKVTKDKNITIQEDYRNNMSRSYLFYKGWFLGYYDVLPKKSLKQRISGERHAEKYMPSTKLTDKSIENSMSITQRVKLLTMKDEKKKNEKGQINFDSYFGNGQEYGSEQQNSYQEVSGQINTTVLNIPVTIEGYYTTQDKNRVAKASYLRVHYNIDESKQKLQKKVSTYKSSFLKTQSQVQSYNKVYQPYIDKLSTKRKRLIYEIEQSYKVDYNGALEYDESTLDSLYGYKEMTNEDRTELRNKLLQIKETSHNIKRYKDLLESRNTSMYFDSLQTYARLEKVSSEGNTYKSQLKSAETLYPKGQSNSFLSGLTHLEAGILNKYESKYTMSGQVLKGGSIGYDFGYFNSSISAGKTEYISRDGNLDRYNTYSVNIDLRPIGKQKFSVIYYTLIPTKQVFSSEQFNSDISIPKSYAKGNDIVSIIHEGIITKDIAIRSEAASSFEKNNKKSIDNNNVAFNTEVVYNIPKTSAELNGELEYVGKDFQNSALPYNNVSTERYVIGGKIRTFEKLISVGIQYNLFKQSSFASTGYNKKWGFDITTHSKRYPRLYLAYKPFSTFRRFDDTLSAQQSPLIGEVYIFRSVYQIKRNEFNHRFMCFYNKNNSKVDSTSYNSSTVQLMYIMLYKSNSISISLGLLQTPELSTVNVNNGESKFVNISLSRNVKENINVNVGNQIAWRGAQIQRYAMNIGLSYQIQKLPITTRCQLRYSKFNNDIYVTSMSQTNIWYMYLGVSWRIFSNDNF